MCKKLKSQDGFLKSRPKHGKKSAASLDELAGSSKSHHEISLSCILLLKILKKCSGRQMPSQSNWGIKCHPGVIDLKVAPWGYRSVKGHSGVIGESKAAQASKGRHQGS